MPESAWRGKLRDTAQPLPSSLPCTSWKAAGATPSHGGGGQGNVTAGEGVLSDFYTIWETGSIVIRYMLRVFRTSFIHVHVLLLMICFWY